MVLLALFSCKNEKQPAETEFQAAPASQEPQEVPTTSESKIRPLSKTKRPPLLSLLTIDKRKEITAKGTLVMDEAWKSAKAHTPEGFVFVQGGRYERVNRPRGGCCREEELLSFYMSDHEVTQKEYNDIIGSNPSNFKGEDQPVENVDWYNAIEYCNKRSISEGLTPYYWIYLSDRGKILVEDSEWNHVAGKDYLDFMSNDDRATGYRLPTEAEWEYAANGGKYRTNLPYSSSEEPKESAWTAANSNETHHPVKEKKINVLGLYDMSGNVAEWTDSRTGSWDDICIRGGSWKDNETFTVTTAEFCDVDETSNTLGFRVVRNIPANDMRYPGIVFSDNLNVRNAPGISGEVINTLPTLTPVAIYEASGSGKYKNGILDIWLKISEDEQWVNAYYVAMLPFFTRETGRINTLAELTSNITDDADIREPGFQFYWLDWETKEIIEETPYRDVYYESTLPFYGIPKFENKAIREEWLFSLPNEQTDHKWWSVYALYDNERNKDLCFTYTGTSMNFDRNGEVMLDEHMDYPDELKWSLSGNANLELSGEYRGKHTFSVYFIDDRHMVLMEQKDEGICIYWLCAWPDFDDEHLTNAMIQNMTGERVRAAGLEDREPLCRILYYNYDSSSERKKMWEDVSTLIKRGAPVNFADRTGYSPLHYAAKHWDEGAVRSLLDAGANPYFRNMADEMPVDLVTEMYWNDNAGTEGGTRSLLEKAMNK